MPPPTVMPSNMLMAAVTAFRSMVNAIQGTEDPTTRLAQTIAGLSDTVNMFEKLATSTAAFEQQFDHANQQMQDLRELVQAAQTTAPRRRIMPKPQPSTSLPRAWPENRFARAEQSPTSKP